MVEPKLNPAFNKSPCVGRCSTVYGDAICRGCKRFIIEVANWNQYSIQERASVWHRLDLLAAQILPEYLVLLDTAILTGFMQKHGIRYPEHQSSQSWVLQCIENFPLKLQDLPQAGLQLTQAGAKADTLKTLKLKIQKAIYTLSIAQKERQEQQPQSCWNDLNETTHT